MRGTSRGLALYLLLAAVIFLVVFSAGSRLQKEELYSHEQFGFDLESGTVTAVNVKPYNKTPTGQADVTLKNGRVKTLYVADVSELEKDNNGDDECPGRRRRRCQQDGKLRQKPGKDVQFR